MWAALGLSAQAAVVAVPAAEWQTTTARSKGARSMWLRISASFSASSLTTNRGDVEVQRSKACQPTPAASRWGVTRSHDQAPCMAPWTSTAPMASWSDCSMAAALPCSVYEY